MSKNHKVENASRPVAAVAAELIDTARSCFDGGHFIKLSLGHYKGADADLKQVHIRPVLIKGQTKLGFTYRYKRRDIVKNYDIEDGLASIAAYLEYDFHAATLFTPDFDLIYERRKEVASLRKGPASQKEPPSLAHDRQKKRLIEAQGQSYLQALGLSGPDGKIFKKAQDKYRQINRYVEILAPLVGELPNSSAKDGALRVVDMGAGKGYLTFALYDYLRDVAGRAVQLTGVEYRDDLVAFCNDVAARAGYDDLRFAQGTIGDYEPEQGTLDILIALHACDTATDDALYKGITAQAGLIVVAPCCHKQIRREIEISKIAHGREEAGFLFRHGIFCERQAEMITDGLRALILEYHGYRTKIFEFVSDAHTAKNIMITAQKDPQFKLDKSTIRAEIKTIKSYFGISSHYLERLAGL